MKTETENQFKVLEVGDEVTHVAVGDRCSVEPYMNCGHCYACRQGASNCCVNLKVIGVMIDASEIGTASDARSGTIIIVERVQ